MKKILIKAYAQLNLGDDLFIKLLCERYKDVEFYLYATEEYKNLKGIESENLKLLYSDSFQKKLINKIGRKLGIANVLEDKLCKEMDGVVNIGGSIFMENDFSMEDFKIRERNLKNGKNYFIMGANFGPYKTEEYLNMYREFFKKCKDICFRDNYSYELFKELPNVRVGKDIVFSIKGEKKEGEYILFSLILPKKKSGLSEDQYFTNLKNLVFDLVKDGKKVKFISFCSGEGDEEAIEKLSNMIPNEYQKNISKYFYRGDLKEALEVIENSSAVVATRFHAMILGFAFGKKVLPISYSNKMVNVLNDIDFKGKYATFSNFKNLNMEVLNENPRVSEEQLESLAIDGELHFKELDKFLNEKGEL